MIKQIIDKLVYTFRNFDKKIIKILKYGFYFCFLIAIISVIILSTYLFFIHSDFIFKIGLLTFEISLYFAVEFIASAITVDTIYKQIT